MTDSPGRGQPASEDAVALTIIMATFNAASTLQRCLDSIWEQDHPSIQVVVMDGGSTDDTVAILEKNSDRIDYWRSEPDGGIYDAWNKGLDHVAGDWVSFLGADDQLAEPTAMSRMASALKRLEADTRVAYGSQVIIDADGNEVRRLGAPWSEIRDLVSIALPLPQPATFHRRSLFEEHGRFDTSYRICGDYEFLLRDIVDRDPVFIPDVVIVKMQQGGVSDDPSWQALLHIENHRAQYRHGLTMTPAWRTPHVVRSHARMTIRRVLGPEREASIVRGYRRLVRRGSRG